MAFLFDAAQVCPTCPNAQYPDNLGKWAKRYFIHAHSRYSRFEIVNGVNIVNVFTVVHVFTTFIFLNVNKTNNTNRLLNQSLSITFTPLCNKSSFNS